MGAPNAGEGVTGGGGIFKGLVGDGGGMSGLCACFAMCGEIPYGEGGVHADVAGGMSGEGDEMGKGVKTCDGRFAVAAGAQRTDGLKANSEIRVFEIGENFAGSRGGWLHRQERGNRNFCV